MRLSGTRTLPEIGRSGAKAGHRSGIDRDESWKAATAPSRAVDPRLDDAQPVVEHGQIGDGHPAMTPNPTRPSSRAGVVAHISAAWTRSTPQRGDERREDAIHRRHASGNRPVVEARDVADGDRQPAEPRARYRQAGRSRRCRRRSPSAATRLSRQWRRASPPDARDGRRQMSSAATSSLASTAPTRPGSRCVMRAHAIEEMRRVAGAGGDRRLRFLE